MKSNFKKLLVTTFVLTILIVSSLAFADEEHPDPKTSSVVTGLDPIIIEIIEE